MPRCDAHKIMFTAPRIGALPLPVAKKGKTHARCWWYDLKQPGCSVMVTSAGVRTFYAVRGVGKFPVRIRLGRFPELSVVDARAKTIGVLKQIDDGLDPMEVRKRARQLAAGMPTFQSAWDDYHDNYLKPSCSAKTAQNDGYLFACVPWKKQRLNTIDTASVRRLHDKLTRDNGATMANRVVQLLQRLFNHATAEMGFQGANPIRARHGRKAKRDPNAVHLNAEKSRARYVLPEEFPRFYTAVARHKDKDFHDLVLLLLYTAARRNNVQAMRWEEVDIGQAQWNIPKTKNGDPVAVPLSAPAIDILARRAKNRGDDKCPWVFPGKRSKSGHVRSASGHVEEPKKQWKALLQAAGIENLHMHDLRRTLATYQRTTGASLETIGAVLGHRTREVTTIYARIDMRPVLKSVNAAASAMLADSRIPPKPVKLLPAGETK